MTLISLHDERLDREMRLVSLAMAVRETLFQAMHDFETPAVALSELLDNFDRDMAWSDHLIAYRMELAAAAVAPGAIIGPIELTEQIDPVIHDRVLKRDREYLASVESKTGVPLLRRRR